MHLNIISDTKRRIPRRKTAALVSGIDKEEKRPGGTVNIIFTRNKRIASLNRAFRGISKPTDVLSFNIDEGAEKGAVFGEIYISTDMAGRYAEEDGISFSEEILRLCCHGYLHLLGYDHKKKADEAVMRRKENHYLEKVHRCL